MSASTSDCVKTPMSDIGVFTQSDLQGEETYNVRLEQRRPRSSSHIRRFIRVFGRLHDFITS
jgi:hypothetical protein